MVKVGLQVVPERWAMENGREDVDVRKVVLDELIHEVLVRELKSIWLLDAVKERQPLGRTHMLSLAG